MPDVDTPDPETPPTPEQIDAWPSGRIADETPTTAPNPAARDPGDDVEDGSLESPLQPGDGLAQPSGGVA